MDEILQAVKLFNSNSEIFDELAKFLFNFRLSLIRVGFSEADAQEIIVCTSRNIQQSMKS
jgi:hypothetical protein